MGLMSLSCAGCSLPPRLLISSKAAQVEKQENSCINREAVQSDDKPVAIIVLLYQFLFSKCIFLLLTVVHIKIPKCLGIYEQL